MSRRLTFLVALLAVLGAVITGYLTIQHGSGNSPACVVGHGCTVIASSKYAHVGALPTASFGLLTYLTVLMLSVVRLSGPPPNVERTFRRVSLAITTGGTLLSGWLMYVAFVELSASCVWCIGSASTITLMFLLLAAQSRPGLADEQENTGASESLSEPGDPELAD